MVKNLFKIIIILLFLAFLIAGARQFLLNKKTASAQHPFFGGLVCDEPIPIGEVLEDAQVLLDDVYKKYRALHQAVSLEVQSGQNWQAELYKTEEVCDFSKCQSLCANSSPDLVVKGTALGVGVTPAYEFCSPICVEKQCSGEPCPDAQEYLDMFGVADELIKQSYADIEVLFAANKAIPNDVKKEDDKPGAQISQIEVLRRKLELAGEWLSPYSGIGKRTCALSSTERARVEAGEIGDRFSMKCVEALENGVYWPKAWSEKCESQCKEEKLSDDCRNCLSQDPGNEGSALAKINYKIYGVCQDSCRQGLTEKCNDCLCEGLSEDECTAWVCGGSYYNWVCCHETLLEEREPVPVTPVPPGPGVAGDCDISAANCSDAGLNICGQDKTTDPDCSSDKVKTWNTQVEAAVSEAGSVCDGVDTVLLVKAIMSQESGGDITEDDGVSAGLMQLKPETASTFKTQCGASGETITFDWLKDPDNAQKQICMAIEYLKTLVDPCGCDVRHLAAGYNGGGAALGACTESTNCGSAAAAEGGQCLMCADTGFTRRWECLWDDNEHTDCNVLKTNNFNFTRRYVPKVNYCYSQF